MYRQEEKLKRLDTGAILTALLLLTILFIFIDRWHYLIHLLPEEEIIIDNEAIYRPPEPDPNSPTILHDLPGFDYENLNINQLVLKVDLPNPIFTQQDLPSGRRNGTPDELGAPSNEISVATLLPENIQGSLDRDVPLPGTSNDGIPGGGAGGNETLILKPTGPAGGWGGSDGDGIGIGKPTLPPSGGGSSGSGSGGSGGAPAFFGGENPIQVNKLASWMRAHPYEFSEQLKEIMEWRQGDLTSRVLDYPSSHGQYTLYLLCRENSHVLFIAFAQENAGNFDVVSDEGMDGRAEKVKHALSVIFDPERDIRTADLVVVDDFIQRARNFLGIFNEWWSRAQLEA